MEFGVEKPQPAYQWVSKCTTCGIWNNGVFSKWSRTFIEFSEFRESEKSLKHELGSILGSALLPVSLWSSGIIFVSYTGDHGFQPHNPHFWFLTFWENSNMSHIMQTHSSVNVCPIVFKENMTIFLTYKQLVKVHPAHYMIHF